MICPLTYEINVQPFGQLLQTKPNPFSCKGQFISMNIQMPFPKVFKLSVACVYQA
jgi:hypothetical protein